MIKHQFCNIYHWWQLGLLDLASYHYQRSPILTATIAMPHQGTLVQAHVTRGSHVVSLYGLNIAELLKVKQFHKTKHYKIILNIESCNSCERLKCHFM